MRKVILDYSQDDAPKFRRGTLRSIVGCAFAVLLVTIGLALMLVVMIAVKYDGMAAIKETGGTFGIYWVCGAILLVLAIRLLIRSIRTIRGSSEPSS